MNKETLENMADLALSYLNQAQCLVKIGALASDSCITDDELQINFAEDYYMLLRDLNTKIQEAITVLDI